MHSFTYQYEGESFYSTVTLYYEDGYPRCKVFLPDGLPITIAPSGIPGLNRKIIWVQSNKPGETIQPHGLVQAIGEEIEKIFTISLPKLFFS
jgi:hypothetical protein